MIRRYAYFQRPNNLAAARAVAAVERWAADTGIRPRDHVRRPYWSARAAARHAATIRDNGQMEIEYAARLGYVFGIRPKEAAAIVAGDAHDPFQDIGI